MDDIGDNFNRVPYRCQIWLGDNNKTISQVSSLGVDSLLFLYVRCTQCNRWKHMCSWHLVEACFYHIWVMTLYCSGHVCQHLRDLGPLSCILPFSTSISKSPRRLERAEISWRFASKTCRYKASTCMWKVQVSTLSPQASSPDVFQFHSVSPDKYGAVVLKQVKPASLHIISILVYSYWSIHLPVTCVIKRAQISSPRINQ
jgi:hypothetical protein